MRKYQLSPNVRVISDPESGTAMVYHALYGNPRIVNDEGLRFLSLFRQPATTEKVFEICDEDPRKTIREFAEIFFLVESGFDEKKFLREKKNSNSPKYKSDERLIGWVLRLAIRATSAVLTVYTSNP